ncbi:hypothetical protein [Paenibacillus sp. NRS-1781]|uniref:hypothetical protein n=1 Tax=Paenibacillus sp. NRS-1781 TaxID=3233905 RepID=UPI003D274877
MSRLTDQEFSQVQHYFVNKGTSQSLVAIDRCIFLSIGAKQLYRNLCQYAYGNKKTCYPGQALLMLELGISSATLDKYLDELREVGLITTSRYSKGTLLYKLENVWEPFCLHHSEWIWMMIELIRSDPDSYSRVSNTQIKKIVYEYKRSELYNDSFDYCNENMGEYVQRICDWFSERLGMRINSTFNDWKVIMCLGPEIMVPNGNHILHKY